MKVLQQREQDLCEYAAIKVCAKRHAGFRRQGRSRFARRRRHDCAPPATIAALHGVDARTGATVIDRDADTMHPDVAHLFLDLIWIRQHLAIRLLLLLRSTLTLAGALPIHRGSIGVVAAAAALRHGMRQLQRLLGTALHEQHVQPHQRQLHPALPCSNICRATGVTPAIHDMCEHRMAEPLWIRSHQPGQQHLAHVLQCWQWPRTTQKQVEVHSISR
eukprot:366366-Chlamydomonas_euryale.AAC.26